MENPADQEKSLEQQTTPPEGTQPPAEDSLADRLAAAEAEKSRLEAEQEQLRADAEAWRQKQDAEKSELQKAQEAAAEQKDELAQARLENARLKAANKFGIAEENLDLLTGTSAEELDSRARKLADLQKKSQMTPPPSETPTENLTPGGGDTPPAEDNAFPSSWAV